MADLSPGADGNARKPFCVTAIATHGPLKGRNALISGHDTFDEALWVAERLHTLFGIGTACADTQ